MTALRTLFAVALANTLLIASLAAQQGGSPSLTVTPDVLKAGDSTTVSYSNPAMAGQTVVIDVDNGMRKGTLTQVIEITLDAKGEGSVSWTVPNWWGANFNAPGVAEVHAPILRS